jgi:Domain of unknown function (DUF397)
LIAINTNLPAPDAADKTFWYKSSYSNGGGNCIEIARLADGVGVRDSKAKAGPVILVPSSVWSAFIVEVRSDRC